MKYAIWYYMNTYYISISYCISTDNSRYLLIYQFLHFCNILILFLRIDQSVQTFKNDSAR